MSVPAINPNTNIAHCLLLDTQSELTELSTDLRKIGGWQLTVTTSADQFIQLITQQKYDIALIATTDAMSCNRAFTATATQQPESIRVIVDRQRRPNSQLNHLAELAHYWLGSTESIASFTEKTTRMVKLSRLVHKTKTREYVNSLGKLPSPPKVYQELSTALSSERSNAKEIGKIISEDPALAVKVLKVVNSAYFGLGRQISNIQEAVTLLGVRTLRSLSISGQLLNQYPQHRNWSYFSFEAMNKRSVIVARLAQHICLDLKQDATVADQAFIGGLLHDLGMLIFASQDSDSYRKIMVKSAQTQTHVCIVEKEMLGIFHGEIAAYLLTQWKLPPAVAEAVLLHHTPQLGISKELSPLAAVHIADALIPEITTEIGALIGNQLHASYVKALQLDDHIDSWKKQAQKMFDEAQL